jgi:hypothetical protein
LYRLLWCKKIWRLPIPTTHSRSILQVSAVHNIHSYVISKIFPCTLAKNNKAAVPDTVNIPNLAKKHPLYEPDSSNEPAQDETPHPTPLGRKSLNPDSVLVPGTLRKGEQQSEAPRTSKLQKKKDGEYP